MFVVYSVSRSKEDVGGMEEGWEVVCVGEQRGGGVEGAWWWGGAGQHPILLTVG